MIRQELRSRNISDLGIRKLRFHPFEYADRVRGSAIVVSKENRSLLGEGADNRDALH